MTKKAVRAACRSIETIRNVITLRLLTGRRGLRWQNRLLPNCRTRSRRSATKPMQPAMRRRCRRSEDCGAARPRGVAAAPPARSGKAGRRRPSRCSQTRQAAAAKPARAPRRRRRKASAARLGARRAARQQRAAGCRGLAGDGAAERRGRPIFAPRCSATRVSRSPSPRSATRSASSQSRNAIEHGRRQQDLASIGLARRPDPPQAAGSAARASASARSFSGWPAWPRTQFQSTSCGAAAASSRCQRSMFLTGFLSAVRQPRAFHPGSHWVIPSRTILAVGVEHDPARPLQRLERGDRRRQLHAVVGGRRLAAAQLALDRAIAQDRAPAARARVAAAGAVGEDFDLGRGQRDAVRGRCHSRPGRRCRGGSAVSSDIRAGPSAAPARPRAGSASRRAGSAGSAARCRAPSSGSAAISAGDSGRSPR